jgi:hypothetical protein
VALKVIVADDETIWSKIAHSIRREHNLNSYFFNRHNNRGEIVAHMIMQQLWKDSEVVKLTVPIVHSGLIVAGYYFVHSMIT